MTVFSIYEIASNNYLLFTVYYLLTTDNRQLTTDNYLLFTVYPFRFLVHLVGRADKGSSGQWCLG